MIYTLDDLPYTFNDTKTVQDRLAMIKIIMIGVTLFFSSIESYSRLVLRHWHPMLSVAAVVMIMAFLYLYFVCKPRLPGFSVIIDGGGVHVVRGGSRWTIAGKI